MVKINRRVLHVTFKPAEARDQRGIAIPARGCRVPAKCRKATTDDARFYPRIDRHREQRSISTMRMADAADAAAVYLWQTLQIVHCAHRVIDHLRHNTAAGVALVDANGVTVMA